MNPIMADRALAERVNGGHFREVAGSYNHYRHLDIDPIHYLVRKVPGGHQAVCDLGTGTGRYLLSLVRAFNEAGVAVTAAYGVDTSPEMLAVAREEFSELPIRFQWLQGTADSTGILSNRLTLVTSFNSFHHFPVEETLREVARILKPGGLLGIYIRTRDQESEHIWGRYFPGFLKHTQVPTRAQMEELPRLQPALRLTGVRVFSYVRTTTFDWVCQQAWNKHYSTFAHYSDEEFESAFARFRATLRQMHADRGPILYRSSCNLFLYQLRCAGS
jgi:ubiquinone/menaquinone biosynthesis C-methylase UbiE